MNWIQRISQWENWPFRQGVGEDPTEKDTPAQRTSTSDYILFHGTSLIRAIEIIKTKQLKPDNWHMIGVNTTPSNAGTYASMKAVEDRSYSAIIKLIIDKSWFESQELHREVGGTGVDSWLINAQEMPLAAIKEMSLFAISGDPNWQNDPELVERYNNPKKSVLKNT